MYEEIPNVFILGLEELKKKKIFSFLKLHIFKFYKSTPEKMFSVSILGLAVVTGVRMCFRTIKINARLDKGLSLTILALM